ncbi:MAG TPA: acyltransferase [Cellvibrio sp.]|nr:acyltransferase [Cellvibrio sp.]
MNIFIDSAKQRGFSVPLHALRGLAAVIVLLCHIQARIEEGFPQFTYTHIFNGSAAVIFFFVLSGLVVGASLAKGGITFQSTLIYAHRRVFRIMPLVIVTVTLGGLYLLYVDPHMPYSFNPKSYGEFDLVKFVASYVGYSLKANPPTWSIFVELVASALIPLMILSGKSIRLILLATAICIALSLLPYEFQHYWNFYMISFYLGLSVLWWGQSVANSVARLPNALFWFLVGGLFSFFYLIRLVSGAGYGDLWIVYCESIPVALLVAIIYYSPERFQLLSKPVFKFLGDISYSLYLTHTLLLILLLNGSIYLLGSTTIAALVFIASSIVLSLILATYSYHHIEMKGMRLGEGIRKQTTLFQEKLS